MTAIILLALGLGGLAAGILVGRYYVPDDRALKRTARHARSYVKTINLLLARERDAAVAELVAVVAENVDDVEPYFALGALFRNRGEWERAIRVHQAIELRSRDNRKQCLRARYQLGLDFRAAGMPRRATRAMEDCLSDDPKLIGALRALSGLYEEQGRFAEAASTWKRIAKLEGTGDSQREHHLLCAAAQRAIENADLDSAKRFLRDAERIDDDSAHLLVASAELAAAKANWQGASARLRQALSVRPELVAYLAGPLQAAELELHAEASDDTRKQEATRGVVAALSEVQEHTGAQPLLALASAEMQVDLDDGQAREQVETLVRENPKLLAARVASARLALRSGDSDRIQSELDALVGSEGLLASALVSSWACSQCDYRSSYFFWRCERCRNWGSVVRDTAASPTLVPQEPRERRAEERGLLPSGDALPVPRLESGLSMHALQKAESRPSALGRAGQWLSSALGRTPSESSKSEQDLD